MKIVILGGSGLIGKKLALLLRQGGHEVTAASPSSGVNAVTGEGLRQALEGAQVVVDVTNSPSFEDQAVMDFFRASTRNVLEAATRAGVRHFVALSVVGAERVPESGYFRAKVAQECLIHAGRVPFTIVRATQFFEFLPAIADAGTRDGTVRVPPAPIQPIAAADVAAALADRVLREPLNGAIEVAGPESYRLDALMRKVLATRKDAREVVADAQATYFGTPLAEDSLVPVGTAAMGSTTLESWFKAEVK